jgi:chromosome segregation ATPase
MTELTNDDGFGLEAIEALDVENMPPLEDEPEEIEEIEEPEEELETDEAEEEPEDEPEEDPQPKKKRGANARIQDLTSKLREKDEKLAELERKLDNLQQGMDYFKPKEEAKTLSLDEQLQQAAVAVDDKEFDLDDFTTDAEKKAALMGYRNQLTIRQQEQQAAVTNIRSQYAQTVEYYKTQDPEISKGLVDSYNAAVRDEARAIMRRYPNLSPTDAAKHAEKALLTEAQQAQDPVMFIAQFGKQILDDAKQYLTTPKERGKIDHKNREAVRARAGKPEIDTAPMTKRAQQVNEAFEAVSTEW